MLLRKMLNVLVFGNKYLLYNEVDTMHKIFYEDIFITDLITNKSMTIEEMLEAVDFDEQSFKEKHGFESLDPADFRATYFNFNASLPFIKAETEELTEVDGSVIKYTFKRIDIGGHLTLYLYDNAQATLEYRNTEIETFYWDDRIERMFSNLDNVSIDELFDAMYKRRWQSIMEIA